MPAALKNQGRVLYALFLAELNNRFARRSLGLFEELGGILIHVIGFSALRLFAGAKTHYGMPEIAFLVAGVFTYWIFKTTIVPVSSFQVAKSRYPALPRVTQLDVLLARAAVNIVLYLGVSMGTFYVLQLIGLSGPMYQPWLVFLLLLLSGVWGIGAGLVCGAIFTFAPIIRTLMSGILRIVMYTSGIFFLWPEVPYKLRFIAINNPFFHLAEFMHQAYFKSYRSAVADWHFLTVSIVLTITVGLAVERLVRPLHGRDRKVTAAEEDNYAFDF